MRNVKLSANFTRAENACRCGDCAKYGADIQMIDMLEELRADVRANVDSKAIINVHSWYRCPAHNNRPTTELSSNGIRGAGSNDNSWHLTGGAVDLSVPNVEPIVLSERFRIIRPNQCGLGLYDWGIHIDIRKNKAFWDERSRRVA